MLGVVLLACTGSAQAGDRIFDPTLSLTGGCGTSEVDPVADPGCPEKHPPNPFAMPISVTTDFYGDIYVANYGEESANGAEGRIDIFDPNGVFITEIDDKEGPKGAAVDSKGNVYVINFQVGIKGKIRRYSPTHYDPKAGEIEYGGSPVTVEETAGLSLVAPSINPVNDHLFLNRGHSIFEYGSKEEGNALLDKTIGEGNLNNSNGLGMAVDAAHKRLYASDNESVKVFELEAPHKLLMTVEGKETPSEKIGSHLAVAVDEGTGRFFVYDETAALTLKVVYEFTESGEYLGAVEFPFQYVFGAKIGVDNGAFSPNVGYLYVPSGPTGTGKSLAFAPTPETSSPQVEFISQSEVTDTEAELRATINPGGLETEYVFEYTPQETFEAEGFESASVAGEGRIPAGLAGVAVSASVSGLEPETEYRFQVVAENECEPENPACRDEAEGSFATYPEEEIFPPCPNEATRTGLSALLPDCRAYELVTPPDTNARTPRGIGKFGIFFASREASFDGDKVSFMTEGGTIPGGEGTGSLSGDAYLATRGEAGWTSAGAGPNGMEAVSPLTGSTSPDQGYSFWGTGGPEGSASVGGKSTTYLRYPDGHSALIGRGSVANDPWAEGQLISENRRDVIFISNNSVTDTAVQLEPNAPPDGTSAVYDRTIEKEAGEEETHVVSLLPGSVTPSAGQNAEYLGTSLDGKGVAFSIGKKLYLRYNNEETYEIGENVTFAGVAEGGARIFYLEGGDLFAFDAEEEKTIRFTEAGDVTPVNVAPEGAAAYFVSPNAKLTGEEENPNGAKAQEGEENLYLSREGAISFVGVVTKRDVEGEFGKTEQTGGLGLWTAAVGGSGGNAGRFAEDPSRTTPDGNALLFESRADLAGYDPEGHAEVYRYGSSAKELECLSCNPTQVPATSDASLQSILQVEGGPEPFNSLALAGNLRADGRRAFFQSREPLVQNDTDGLQDVYEWEAQGVGSCERPEGCIYLISSGQSKRNDYLYGTSNSGNDVFFRTSDLLLPVDKDETPSIYDARVGGGFPEPVEEPCQGEGCRPNITPPPLISHSESKARGNEEEPPPKPCPKGKHNVTKGGKTSCVKKHHKRKHRKAGSKKKGGGK